MVQRSAASTRAASCSRKPGCLIASQPLTLHWEALAAFRERYPGLNATQELFEIDDRRITCAGGTASIDMMLDLIGRRHGADLAAAISEQFVVSRIRQRSDSQRLEIARATACTTAS